eukprot:gene10905-17025_t
MVATNATNASTNANKTTSYSSARAKELYLAFYDDTKTLLRTISTDVPDMAVELSIVIALMKVLKKVNVRLPFKYYYVMMEGPFGDHLRSCNKQFFMEDPRFSIDGYDALTQLIRRQLKTVDPAYVDSAVGAMHRYRRAQETQVR